MLRIKERTALAVMVIALEGRNNIIFQEIKLLSSNPERIGSQNVTGNYKAAFCISTLIVDKPELRIQSTPQQ